MSISVSYAVFLGFIHACITSFLALNIAGGGDGWNSAMISACSLLLMPLASATLVLQVRGTGKIMGALVLGVMVLADILLVVLTLREGTAYVRRVTRAAPVLVLCWATFWIGGQIAFTAIWAGRKEFRKQKESKAASV